MRAGLLAWALAFAVALPSSAQAFCGMYVSGSSEGLYNNASRVALVRVGTRTVLSMSNDYQGPPQDFAMIVPVPVVLQRANVRTLPHSLFEHLETISAPRLVEYQEQNPCEDPRVQEFHFEDDIVQGSLLRPDGQLTRARPAVRVEAAFETDEYNIVVLSATESDALERWLRSNHYNIPSGAAESLAPYVREGSKFFVARVALNRVRRLPDGRVRLSPLRFFYDTPEFRLPVRLGLLNANGPQDLLVYVFYPGSRIEVSNYDNAFIPTNLALRPAAAAQFGAFYGRLFDAAHGSRNARTVFTEYVENYVHDNSYHCDPCPTPPPTTEQWQQLGGDVLPVNLPAQPVFTRLHVRYDRESMTEDLVFRTAPPMRGGYGTPPPNGQLPTEATPHSTNSFQARYISYRPWPGNITCNNPVRGRWGPPIVAPALDPSAANRSNIELTNALSATPNNLGIRLDATTPLRSRARVLPPVPMPTNSSTETPVPTLPTPAPTQRGCACSSNTAVHTHTPLLASVSALFAIVQLVRSRRRKKTEHT